MEKELKPEESIKIINDMISSTKVKLSDNSFYFLFWGWLVAILSLADFVADYFELMQEPHKVWYLIMIGFVITPIYSYKKGRAKKVFTHIDKIQAFTWMGYVISYFIVLFFMKELNYQISALIFILTGFATFVSGFVLKFNPLLIGAIIFWAGAILAFIIPDKFVSLLGFFILILGFVIPGYILKSYKRKNA